MPVRLFFALVLTLTVLPAAPLKALVRTTEGDVIEGDLMNLRPVANVPLARVLSIHSGAPASEYEKKRIEDGIAAIQGTDRKARDLAVEELTAIGVPVMSPLLKIYKDTDQHEPRPLYRLFERVMPSHADGFDRNPGIVRTNGEVVRGVLPSEGDLEMRTLDGKPVTVPWEKIRLIALRQRTVFRSARVHSIQHSIQIEYLDTGVILSPSSTLEEAAKGFVRLSWDADSWASDADGLTKPGSPAYKSHLVNGHPFGALIGRVGAANEPIFLGKKAKKAGLGGGRLGLAVNDNGHWQNNLGTFNVTITATDAYDVGDAQ
jgi:hypothetical protein